MQSQLKYISNLQEKIKTLELDIKLKDELLSESIDRVEDMYRSDDGQAWEEAKRFLSKWGRSKYL